MTSVHSCVAKAAARCEQKNLQNQSSLVSLAIVICILLCLNKKKVFGAASQRFPMK